MEVHICFSSAFRLPNVFSALGFAKGNFGSRTVMALSGSSSTGGAFMGFFSMESKNAFVVALDFSNIA